MVFKITRNRDAWATIRGFLFQAELSVSRWLDLSDTSVLELERGEDIDIVAAALAGGNDISRRLEQVKVRESRVTLTIAAAALASFYEHWITNGRSGLSFRYVTNAKPTSERLSAFPMREPGVIAWERLRLKKATVSEIPELLKAIRHTLSNAKLASDTNADTWDAFQKFLTSASDDALLEFIYVVEWSTNNPSPESIQAELQSRLLSDGYVHTPAGSTELYHRLLLRVLKLLASPGIKRLTADDRQAEVSRGSLSDEDHALLKMLQLISGALEYRITDLEQFARALEQRLEGMVKPPGVVVQYGTPPIMLDVPPSVENVVARRSRIARYKERLNSKTWCAVNGSVGSGKTQLAVLLADGGWDEVLWLRFRDKDAGLSSQYLHAALSVLSQTSSVSWTTVIKATIDELAERTLIVLDDLPYTSGSDQLDDQLITLATLCSRSSIRLFSTSLHRLSSRVRQALGAKVLEEGVPEFSDKEIVDLLSAHGAPPRLCTEKFASWFGSLTKRHPALLTAGIQYLAARAWSWDDEVFGDLLTGKYATREKEQTRRLLVATVDDADTRELLYRLTTVISTITEGKLMAVASAEPPIARPLERVSTVTGLWLQQDSTDTYSLSPLLSQVGSEDLATSTRNSTHLALANHIVSTQSLGPLEVSQAVLHFSSGAAYDQAVRLLIAGLRAFLESETASDDYGLSGYWYGIPLPGEVAPELQLIMRLSQAEVRARLDKEYDKALDDVECLIGSDGVDGTACLTAVALLLSSSLRDSLPFERMARVYARSLELWPTVTTLPPEISDFRPEWIVWLLGTRIASSSDLNQWMDIMCGMTEAQRTVAFESPLALGGVIAVIDALWMMEHEKPAVERDWVTVKQEYTSVLQRTEDLGHRILWAGVVRALITIQGEFLSDLPGAREIAVDALAKPHCNASCFLIKDSLGRQYYYAGQYSDAIQWLRAASECGASGFPYLQTRSLLFASQAAGESDPNLATEFTGAAVALALGEGDKGSELDQTLDLEVVPHHDNLFVVKVLVEHVISLWLNGKAVESFAPLETAVQLLQDHRADEASWKALFCAVGHVCGYITSVVAQGTAPAVTSENEPYAVPFRGIMFGYAEEGLASTYSKAREFFILGQLSILADSIGEDSRAIVWAERMLDQLRAAGNLAPLPVICMQLIVQFVKANRIADALDIGLQAGIALVSTAKLMNVVNNPLFGFDVNQVLGAKSNPEWIEAERHGGRLVTIPLLLEILRRDIRDQAQTRQMVEQIAHGCRTIRDISVDPHYWDQISELFQWFFVERPGAALLLERAKFWASVGRTELQVLCYLAVSISSSPGEALASQLAAFPYLQAVLPRMEFLERSIVTPFLVEYWVYTFENKRIRFSSPAVVEAALKAAVGAPLAFRGRKVLAGVALGLNVRVGDEARRWLQE